MKSGVVDKVRAAGGQVYAITSEPQNLADNAKQDWGLNFETVGDPHHEIAASCRERGWLDIIVNKRTDLIEAHEGSIFRHPKGYFQPGVLALTRDQRILYRWRGVPTRRNMGGATERPTAEYVHEKLQQALHVPDSENGVDADHDLKPKLDMRGIPWPIFVSILTANGWFIKPRPFPHIPGGPTIQTRFLFAILRIPIFVGAWIFAFKALPALWVGLALGAWTVWLTPHIRNLGEQFQNVKLPQ